MKQGVVARYVIIGILLYVHVYNVTKYCKNIFQLGYLVQELFSEGGKLRFL